MLLTKQFTYFLGGAPDPYAALRRFEHLVESVHCRSEGRWLELLSNPRVLQDLARLLGASDFLWEDFIRLQYEALRAHAGAARAEGEHARGPPARPARGRRWGGPAPCRRSAGPSTSSRTGRSS